MSATLYPERSTILTLLTAACCLSAVVADLEETSNVPNTELVILQEPCEGNLLECYKQEENEEVSRNINNRSEELPINKREVWTEEDSEQPLRETKKAAAFQSWGGKRAPSFQSWGGKRAAAFQSWGGKRAAAFQSWGGKRAPQFQSWGGKRAAAFQSWGGKRDPGPDIYFADNLLGKDGDKRAKFNSWGGKRAWSEVEDENKDEEYPDMEKRRDFQSWGGKRDDMDDLNKRRFQSWGGKRDEGLNHVYLPLKYLKPRQGMEGYLNWGMKRRFSSWGGKRNDETINTPQKRIFYQAFKKLWGNTGKDHTSFVPWAGKRGTKTKGFQSWGGKRNIDLSNSNNETDSDYENTEINSENNLHSILTERNSQNSIQL